MVRIPLGELVDKVNIQVREDEIVIFDCEPAHIRRWLFDSLGIKNYKIPWEGYDCLSIQLEPKHLEWFMLRWG